MRRIKLAGGALGLLVLAAMPAGASDAWALVYADGLDASERPARLAVARSLEGRVRHLSNAVPVLGKSEARRLSEREADVADEPASGRGRSRLYLSAAFQQRELRALLDEVNAALSCIPKADSEAAEMVCWGRAAVALQEDQKLRVALSVLRDRRVLPKDRTFPVNGQDPEVWYDAYGKGILRYILYPYLERQVDAGKAAAAVEGVLPEPEFAASSEQEREQPSDDQ
ncbi:MAG: hypothetical protein NXH85_12970 [Pseudomonadaceae bacterium]|nr:hypothetical protein [Pseudomonadaceae bacterium]